MSDGEVQVAIEQMEAWLTDPNWEPDPEDLAKWNEEFRTALATAEKAKGWSDLVVRLHIVGQNLEARIVPLARLRDGVKAELEALECGNRALKSYGASTR